MSIWCACRVQGRIFGMFVIASAYRWELPLCTWGACSFYEVVVALIKPCHMLSTSLLCRDPMSWNGKSGHIPATGPFYIQHRLGFWFPMGGPNVPRWLVDFHTRSLAEFSLFHAWALFLFSPLYTPLCISSQICIFIYIAHDFMPLCFYLSCSFNLNFLVSSHSLLSIRAANYFFKSKHSLYWPHSSLTPQQ